MTPSMREDEVEEIEEAVEAAGASPTGIEEVERSWEVERRQNGDEEMEGAIELVIRSGPPARTGPGRS